MSRISCSEPRALAWIARSGSITALGLIAGIGHLALFFGVSSDLAASGISTNAVQADQGADDGGLLGALLLALVPLTILLLPRR